VHPAELLASRRFPETGGPAAGLVFISRTLWKEKDVKHLVILTALLCLVLAVPASADEPLFLDAQALETPANPGTCDDPLEPSVEAFPEQDKQNLCIIGTYCSDWVYTCSCFGGTRYKKSRTCQEKCCSGSNCYNTGSPYTESSCTQYPCP
jgi:hypothetical protein